MIRPPRLVSDDPGYVMECEEAMEFALNEIGDTAVDAGWSEDVVEEAHLRLAENRYRERRRMLQGGKDLA